MVSHSARRFCNSFIGFLLVVTISVQRCDAQPASTPKGAAPTSSPSQSTPRLTRPDHIFLKLDKNHDKVIAGAELVSDDAAPYRSMLMEADRDENGRITLDEFNRIGEISLWRDPKTAGAMLLILAFASFCLFLDGLLDPEHRDYFLWSIGGIAVLTALAFLFAPSWFLSEEPYLAYVAVVPALLVVLAVALGATREKEEALAAPAGPVVYQVGKKKTEDAATKPAAGSAPRRPSPPVRTPRPAPLPRPAVPERRPKPAPPPSARPTPPRPPGPPKPPGSSKPPQ